MDYSLFWFLGHVSTFIPLVPIILSLLIFYRLTRIQRNLVVLVILAFTADLISYAVWHMWGNNNPIFHIYAVIEFFLVLRIFKFELTHLMTNMVFHFVFISFIAFAIVNVLSWQSIFIFNSNVTTVSSFLIIVLVLLYFYSLLQKEQLEPLGKTSIFWISAGLMLYYATNLVLFFLSTNEGFASENGYTIWGTHAFVNIISYCFYTYALWIQPKTE